MAARDETRGSGQVDVRVKEEMTKRQRMCLLSTLSVFVVCLLVLCCSSLFDVSGFDDLTI